MKILTTSLNCCWLVDNNNDNIDDDVRTKNKNNRFTNLVILNREVPAVNERSDNGC
jgi:hypothetical protein